MSDPLPQVCLHVDRKFSLPAIIINYFNKIKGKEFISSPWHSQLWVGWRYDPARNDDIINFQLS